MSPILIVFALILLVGALVALAAGYLYGRAQNKVNFEERLRAEKEASEQRLLEVQMQQREALHEAHEANAERRAELQRQERRMQQKEESPSANS